MFIAIIGSLAILMAIYLALNAAMVTGLGAGGVARSAAPAADLLGRAFGPAGRALIVAVVAVSAIASINSTMIVGVPNGMSFYRPTVNINGQTLHVPAVFPGMTVPPGLAGFSVTAEVFDEKKAVAQ